MADDDLALDFDKRHTLGFLVTDWIEQHCKVPGGVYEGEPLEFNGWQLFVTANHYRIKPDAIVDTRRLLAPFHYRRSVIVGPQKCGKSPWGAGFLLNEGVGPSLFAGWASGGERYVCADHGCGCGWEYEYQPGEAMGLPRRKSLLGLLALAEFQTANVYEPLQTMIHNGPLSEFVHVREGFIRLPNRGKIVPLSSSAKSKLGQPLTGGLGDESGLYTSANKVLDTWQTMRRGIAAMQGRTVELTNPWDPSENSAAQQAFDSLQKDIFRYYRKPPTDLSYANKRERHRIHVYVYGDSPWVDPTSIDAEAAELVETDPPQAERFFGNRLVHGRGAWMPEGLWERTTAPQGQPEAGTEVCGGFDGSDVNDHTGIRLRTIDGYRFTPTYVVGGETRLCHWDPAQWKGKIPRHEVMAAWGQIAERYKLIRVYLDPPGWDSEITDLQRVHGDEVFVPWYTRRGQQMHDALERSLTDLATDRSTHDGCPITALHVGNARKIAAGKHYILGKPADHQKIDMAMADALAWEAGEDARAAGWQKKPKNAGRGRVIALD